MSELSTSADTSLRNGPESCHVVQAIDALLRNDVTGARVALIAGADEFGWPAVAHRLDVVGRALAVDAGLRTEGEDGVVVVLPDLDTSSWVAGDEGEAEVVLSRWCSRANDDILPTELLWSSLAVVTWLVDRAGYPAEVVV